MTTAKTIQITTIASARGSYGLSRRLPGGARFLQEN